MMKPLLKGVAAAALLAVTACAQGPYQIEPSAVPLDTFTGTSCSRAESLLSVARVNLESLSIRQEKTARNDALGVALVGVPLSSLQGGDKSAEIADLKGEIIALEHRLESC